jgi:tetratricopeptide (TPR) repeat protein
MTECVKKLAMIALVGAGLQAIGQNGPSSQELDRLKRSFFITGVVLLDDGTTPNERVSIERICPTQVRHEAYTDSSGAFSFNLGGETEISPDASINNSFQGFHPPGSTANAPSAIPATTPGVQTGSLSQREAMQCSLRATLAGFHSDTVPLGTLQMAGTNKVGPIVLHRLVKQDRQRIPMTTLQAPPAAKKAYDRARQALSKNLTLDAMEDLREAIRLYPNFAEALVQLGEVYAQQGIVDEAERLFRQSIAADPSFSPPYFDLAPIAGQRGDWKQMAQLSDQGLALDGSSYPAGYYFNALAYSRLGDLDKSEKSAREARMLDPEHKIANVELVLCDVLARRKDFAGAAEQLRTFLKFSPEGPYAQRARDTLAQLESKTPAAK